ncbi:MAG: hypothetical protein II119_03020 [Bacilli bacterium]|nr:hypothetical protein [Bacilli bacterium]MBQ6282492.1 hypothetical protein [Bacilli bacterium]
MPSNFSSYAEALLRLESIDDLLQALPKPSSADYEECLSNLIMYINNEIDSNVELKEDSCDKDDIDSINLELERLNRIREVIVSKLSETYGEQVKEGSKKNLVFLMTNASNPCIEKDLKDIPREYMADLAELLEDLESFGPDEGKYNDLECKKLINNGDLKDVFELIAFKVRLYFEQYDKDTVIVVMATLKNQTNPKSIYDTLSKRLSMKAYDEKRNVTLIDQLKKKLSNPEMKDRLIEEHREIKESIMAKLKGNAK